MRYPVYILSLLLFSMCNINNQSKNRQSDKRFEKIEIKNTLLTYPETREDTSIQEVFFGTEISDPYRWLEDDRSIETGDWVKRQNQLTGSYLSKIDFRDDVRKRLEDLYNYEKFSTPFKEGENYFYFKNNGLQNQSVLYKTQHLEEDGDVFIDPNTFSDDGTVALGTISVNKEGSLFGYSVNKAGSDWQTIKVRDIETGEDLDEHIEWAKFTGISWKGDGFYYGAYPEPKEGQEFSSSNQGMKIYYHKIGTPQRDDHIVFEDNENPSRYFNARVSDDERFLYISAGEGTSGNNLKVKDLTKNQSTFVEVKSTMDTDASVIGNVENTVFLLTNEGAPNKRVVKFTIDEPLKWLDVIPESEHVISGVSKVGDKLFVKYIEDVKHTVYQYTLEGQLDHKIELPGQGTISGFSGKDDQEELFYTYTSITTPPSIYKYTIKNGKSEFYKGPNIDFTEADYETKQIFYTSKDGTKIPMYVVHKKGMQLDGSNPTWLYGYGGFDISIMPSFNPLTIAWIEQGGVYALANIRGGSEYGSKWHDEGRLLNKQNVFDDFILAAEYLIENKYTSTSKLAINGRSNGGLLIGAVMTQRPDLFGVAIPTVGVLDMLRYEKFTIGYAWASDYGSVKEQEHFKNLLSYSPLHNLKVGVEYPPTLVVTADHDDRVVPAHSFKFISTLQKKQSGDNPVLIRIDVDSGHGAGKPTKKVLDEWADVYSFAMYNLGVKPNY